jgi:hypothetical protein
MYVNLSLPEAKTPCPKTAETCNLVQKRGVGSGEERREGVPLYYSPQIHDVYVHTEQALSKSDKECKGMIGCLARPWR